MVTGGSGFLGHRTVPRLLAAGFDVSVLCRSPRSSHVVSCMGAVPVPGDLDDPATVTPAFAACEGGVLVNLASLGFGHASTIVAAAEASCLSRAVFVSTTGIFTALNAPTRAVRLAAEETIRSSGLDWTIVRPTMIYGRPGDRNLERLVRLVRRSPVIPLPGGGHGLQQPVHVDDLADAVVRCLERDGTTGRCFDLAGPEPLTLRELVETTAAVVGRTVRLVPVPLRPAVAGAKVYERLRRRPAVRAEQLERLGEHKAFDISAAVDALGFGPRPFAEGMRLEVSLLR
jgi:uncharacterized protein YbjT (DUF2867 family)